MVSISKGDDGQLIVRCAGCRINQRGQIVIPNGGTPMAVFADKLGFAVSGKITKTNECRMARSENELPKVIGNLLNTRLCRRI